MLDEIIKEALFNGYNNVLINAYTVLSSFLVQTAQIEEAFKIAEESLGLIGSDTVNEKSAAILNNLLICNHRIGNFSKSIEIGTKLLKYYKDLPDNQHTLCKLYNKR